MMQVLSIVLIALVILWLLYMNIIELTKKTESKMIHKLKYFRKLLAYLRMDKTHYDELTLNENTYGNMFPILKKDISSSKQHICSSGHHNCNTIRQINPSNCQQFIFIMGSNINSGVMVPHRNDIQVTCEIRIIDDTTIYSTWYIKDCIASDTLKLLNRNIL